MTETIIYTHKGVRYHLGYIHQSIVNGRIQYIIIPSFEFRPPFTYPRSQGAKNRMLAQASQAIVDGKPVPKETANIYTL